MKFSELSISDLIDEYLRGPQSLRQAIAGMTREQLLARPIAGKWSTQEVVAQLADFEPVYADRMKRIPHHLPFIAAKRQALSVH